MSVEPIWVCGRDNPANTWMHWYRQLLLLYEKKAPKEHRPLAIRSLTHIVIYNHSIYTNINI